MQIQNKKKGTKPFITDDAEISFDNNEEGLAFNDILVGLCEQFYFLKCSELTFIQKKHKKMC